MTDAVRCRRREQCVTVVAAVVVTGARAALPAHSEGSSPAFSLSSTVSTTAHSYRRGRSCSSAASAARSPRGGPCCGWAAPPRSPHSGGRGATWLGSKAVKPFVGRGWPATEVDVARVLDSEQAGLGYPSGHAGVVLAMVAAAAPPLPWVLRPALWLAALGIGGTRVYVSAHLPLDIAGGIAPGIGTERGVRLLAGEGCTPTRHLGSSDTPRSARSSWRS